MSKGYGFNVAHTLAYSLVGLQEANLAYKYPIIYWNCANLISDSGGKNNTTNYGKIAASIGNMKKAGIKVVLPDINRTKLEFYPDAVNNEIVFGLKGIQGVGINVAHAIINNQSYSSMDDFYNKMQVYKSESKENKFGDSTMINLIKAGSFDELENKPREIIMKSFVKSISKPIKKLQFSNIENLNEMNLLTPEQKKYELRLYRFKNYIFNKNNLVYQKGKSANTGYYKLDRKFAEPYFFEHFAVNMVEDKDYEYTDDGYIAVKRGSIEREFDNLTKDFKENVLTNPDFLAKINNKRFVDIWNEKVKSDNISKWEMDSLGYYYHEHELAGVDKEKYGIKDFEELNPDSEIADTFYYRGKKKMRFKLCRICGTVIDKDKNKSTVTLLTLDSVVEVKFYKGQFGFYDRQITENRQDGTVLTEKSWFERGTKLLITGYRRDEQFVPKKYSDSIFKHSVQLIKDIDKNGILSLQSERLGQEREDFISV